MYRLSIFRPNEGKPNILLHGAMQSGGSCETLAERGLTFRGSDENIGSKHGNFPDCIELLAKFDPFLAKHILILEILDEKKYHTCHLLFSKNSSN